jgi:hypothetical protein
MKLKTSLAVAALTCLLAFAARAGSFTLNLDHVFPAFQTSAPTSSIQPWLTATFTDNGLDDVLLTMTALNLSTNLARQAAADVVAVQRSESVNAWWFNINPILSADGAGGVKVRLLNINYVSGVRATLVAQSGGATGQNSEQADSDGFYDFKFVFAAVNTASTFTNGSNSVYELTGLRQVIDASDFVNFFSSEFNGAGILKSPNGPFYETAANIVDTVKKNGRGVLIFDNGFVGAVPEPATWLLVGSMFVLPVLIRFSRRRKQ